MASAIPDVPDTASGSEAIRVLLVEDNPADARLIERMLRETQQRAPGRAWIELAHADRVAAIAAALHAATYDLVLLDLSLPDSRGLETLTRVREVCAHLPIIVLTGLDDEIVGTRAVQEGAQDYLPKGQMDGPALARAIRYACERHRLRVAAEREAQFSAALARVGREMISSLSTPVLLERLCRVTAEVLDCDFSITWLRDRNIYMPYAGFGFDDDWEAIRLLHLPQVLVDDMHTVPVKQIATGARVPGLAQTIERQFGVTVTMYAGLRRGGEVVGIQTSGYRGRTDAFTPEQMRTAAAIADVASIGLENARLVEALERAHRITSSFMATMSHELRSPLNTIMGYSDLLLDGTFGDLTAEQGEAVEVLHKSAADLHQVINATLDLSRFESKPAALHLEAVALATLADQLTTELRPQAAAVPLVWDLEPDLTLATDPVKLKMVLKNLIGNALKFTPAGQVSVRARAQSTGVQFDVTDTGIGIAPEAQAQIFEPFRQAEASIGDRYGGAGLGLYIVRRLVDMLGGSISVESARGCGATFRVWIPSCGEVRACESPDEPASHVSELRH